MTRTAHTIPPFALRLAQAKARETGETHYILRNAAGRLPIATKAAKTAHPDDTLIATIAPDGAITLA